MFRYMSLAAFAILALAAPAMAQESGSVAGRPALSTTTAQDLIAQREKWGSAPTKTRNSAAPAKAAASDPPPPGKAAKAAVAAGSYAVLPTDNVSKLIAERETWGKGPKGYEKKTVVAPRAAGAPKKLKADAPAAKPAKVKTARKLKKKKKSKTSN